jgi:hypothetical protein
MKEIDNTTNLLEAPHHNTIDNTKAKEDIKMIKVLKTNMKEGANLQSTDKTKLKDIQTINQHMPEEMNSIRTKATERETQPIHRRGNIKDKISRVLLIIK